MVSNPLVSILCQAYNHESFIRQCLDGFLMQKTDFSFEILVHDDASTDQTANIIQEYEKNYNNIINPIYQIENQYSQKKRVFLNIQLPRAKGKYIALCEGDDYWTDPYKLQKQVNFLENNPAYVLCCGGYESFHTETQEMKPEIETRFLKKKDGFSFTLNEMSLTWLTKSLTCVFRANSLCKNIDLIKSYTRNRDVHLFYHILKEGKGYYFNEIFGVYRIHSGGIKSLVGDRVNRNSAYNRCIELYGKNKDRYTQALLFRAIVSLLKYNLKHTYTENTFKRKLALAVQFLRHLFSPGLMAYFLKAYLKTLKLSQ